MSNIRLENMPNAYKEVNEILKQMSQEDVDKIPDDFKQIIIKEMNGDYNFVYDQYKTLEEQKLLFETRTILAYMFVNYWANEKQKEKINKKFQNDALEEEEKKKEKYKTEDIFKINNINEDIEDNKIETNKQTETKELIIKKENIFSKILNKIRNLFKF